MAKLFRHDYNIKTGEYKISEINNLTETEKQFSRKSSNDTDDYWLKILKSQLRILNPHKNFILIYNIVMYDIKEDMLYFKELVISHLAKNVEFNKTNYEKALENLEKATKNSLT